MRVPIPEVAVEAVDVIEEVDDFEAPSPPRRSERRPVGNLATPLLVLLIGSCILAGSAALGAVGELLLQVSTVSFRGVHTRPQAFLDGVDPAEWAERMRQAAEERRDTLKFASDMKDTGEGLHRFSRVLWLGGLGTLIGGFAVAIPAFRHRRGLVIAALCVTSGDLLLTLIVRVVPFFTRGAVRDHITMSVLPALSRSVGLALLSLLVDVALIVSLGLFAGAVWRLTRRDRTGSDHKALLTAAWVMGAWGVSIFLLYCWLMINSRITEGAMLYVTWVLHWVTNIVLGCGLFFTIRFLIQLRRRFALH